MFLKKLIPKSAKGVARSWLRSVGYDLVYFKSPGTHHRYPYASQNSFFLDIKSRGYSPTRVLDIGANHGSWSEDLGSVFPAVQSILVEPQKELSEHLLTICRRHQGWKVAPVGVAGENGVRTFRACADTVSSSFLTAGTDGNAVGDVRELTVVTLDRLANDYFEGKTANIVKIDAEGLELEILASGKKTIREADIVMLEVALFEFNPGQPRFVELVRAMDELGHSIYDFSMFYRRPHDGALGLMDCVFVSNTSVLRNSHAW